jgi:hypothetical protein
MRHSPTATVLPSCASDQRACTPAIRPQSPRHNARKETV